MNEMASPANISLLLSDVDGTLVTEDKVLTPRARQAVIRLHDKGIRFAITSGRPPRGMSMLVDPLALTEPIAGFNGGAYVAPDMSVLETHTLAAEASSKAVEMLGQLGLDAWLYTGKSWYLRNPDGPHVARESWTVKFPPEVTKSYEEYYAEAVKIVGISDDYALVQKAESEIGRALDGAASVARSQPYYLDITNTNANKAGVVRYHASCLGIPASEIATMGDMPNDVLMFRVSGFSIAMGNASDEVKSQAAAVTDSCNDDGFAKAVERYFLGGS
jgi:Cof subfamily protein (haloacid dehalogenase superfamily)